MVIAVDNDVPLVILAFSTLGCADLELDQALALGIEYDGTEFSGWQRLTHGETVQGALERALSFVAAHPVEVTCAGRTDAGVHGRCQVVHFDTEVERDMRGWTLGAVR